jgi:hypothetical protein
VRGVLNSLELLRVSPRLRGTMMNDLSIKVFPRIFVLVCATAYSCVLSTNTLAGELGKAKLSEKPVEVLGGRLLVRMPLGAKSEARPFDIMSAPESEEHETRAVFGAGQERLVLMVHENFAFAGDNFEKDVRDWVATWKGKYRIEPVQLPINGLKAVSVVPLKPPDHSRSDDATFVEGVFVASDDRTIQSLDVYVNAAAEQDLEGCKAVAHQILMSVAQGKKRLKLSAGERRLFAYSEDLEISVTVPKNIVTTKQDGPDFLVHRLIVLGRLGADSESIGIYAGKHPDFHPGAKNTEGKMFGKTVEWHSFQKGGGLEALCKLPIPGDIPLFAHVWVQAPNDARLGELKQVAESMKLIKVRKPASK